VELCVSLTCEVQVGQARWWLTRESGRSPCSCSWERRVAAQDTLLQQRDCVQEVRALFVINQRKLEGAAKDLCPGWVGYTHLNVHAIRTVEAAVRSARTVWTPQSGDEIREGRSPSLAVVSSRSAAARLSGCVQQGWFRASGRCACSLHQSVRRWSRCEGCRVLPPLGYCFKRLPDFCRSDEESEASVVTDSVGVVDTGSGDAAVWLRCRAGE
jgi:hypothetical protein